MRKQAIFQTVRPVLPVKNVTAALDFYVTKLGFTRDFQDTADNPHYAGVVRDQVILHLQWHDPAAWERDQVDRPMLRFLIDDVEALYAEYSDKEVFHAHTAVRDTAWGTREFAFFDPDQNGLTFYKPLPDSS